jgi:heme iron utilization protein
VHESTPILDQLRELFASQRLAVLATDHGGHPYASLVAFAVSDDLRELIFATSRDTRKFANLKTNSSVSLLIDNRSNQVADFSQAIAVTILGVGEELTEAARAVSKAVYLDKHPHLKEFVTAPSCALVSVHVQSFYLVSRFQNVIQYHFS